MLRRRARIVALLGDAQNVHSTLPRARALPMITALPLNSAARRIEIISINEK